MDNINNMNNNDDILKNYNYMNKKFNSIDKKHEIEINIIENISWFNINKLDFEYIKTFLILLKDVLIFLKKNNVQNIKQNIQEDDIKYFKNSEIINLNDNLYCVTTNINNFIDEIINVFGINKI